MVYQKFSANLSELLALGNEVSLHISFICKLFIEIFKSLHGLNPIFLSELFETKCNHYFLRSGHQLILPPTNTTTFGIRSLSFMGSLIWNKLPMNVKDAKTLLQFKTLLNNLATNICHCQICNIY